MWFGSECYSVILGWICDIDSSLLFVDVFYQCGLSNSMIGSFGLCLVLVYQLVVLGIILVGLVGLLGLLLNYLYVDMGGGVCGGWMMGVFYLWVFDVIGMQFFIVSYCYFMFGYCELVDVISECQVWCIGFFLLVSFISYQQYLCIDFLFSQ